jgi:hypothetical protein
VTFVSLTVGFTDVEYTNPLSEIVPLFAEATLPLTVTTYPVAEADVVETVGAPAHCAYSVRSVAKLKLAPAPYGVPVPFSAVFQPVNVYPARSYLFALRLAAVVEACATIDPVASVAPGRNWAVFPTSPFAKTSDGAGVCSSVDVVRLSNSNPFPLNFTEVAVWSPVRKRFRYAYT